MPAAHTQRKRVQRLPGDAVERLPSGPETGACGLQRGGWAEALELGHRVPRGAAAMGPREFSSRAEVFEAARSCLFLPRPPHA